LGFNLSRQNILDAFAALGYDIFAKKGEWNSENKEYTPSIKGTAVRFEDGYSNNNAMFIYIDIEPGNVRQLMLTTITLVPNTSMEKILNREKIKKEIELFKQIVKDNFYE
jgi:hypothetical protein